MAEKKLDLLNDFPAVSTERWMEAVTKDLKGAEFEKRLVWHTNEGFNVQPFYRADSIETLQTTDVKPAAFSNLQVDAAKRFEGVLRVSDHSGKADAVRKSNEIGESQ